MAVDSAFLIGFASIAATILSILAAGFLVYVGYLWQKRYEAEGLVEDIKARIGNRIYRAFVSPPVAALMGIPEGYDKARLDGAFERFGSALNSLDTAKSEGARRVLLPDLLHATREIAACLPMDSMEMSKVLITGATETETEPLPIDRWISGTRPVASTCAWIVETRSELLVRTLDPFARGSELTAASACQGILDLLKVMQAVDSDLHALTKARRDVLNLRVSKMVPGAFGFALMLIFGFFLGVILPLWYAIVGYTNINDVTGLVFGFFFMLALTIGLVLLLREPIEEGKAASLDSSR
jgi:hypothetical protein